jgi:hypothetical protein
LFIFDFRLSIFRLPIFACRLPIFDFRVLEAGI